MYKHVYKLKMTVNGTEYFAPITWTGALDTVFNGRSKRVNDKNYPSSSTKTTLSEYLTNGVGLTNDSVIPAFAKKTNFSWKGYQSTDYTNISGPINKVTLMSENITNGSDFLSRTNSNLFYKEGANTLNFRSQYNIGGENASVIAQDKNNNIICVSPSYILSGGLNNEGLTFYKGYCDEFKFNLSDTLNQQRSDYTDLNFISSVFFNKDELILSDDDIATALGYEQEYEEIPYPDHPSTKYKVFNCFALTKYEKNISFAQNENYIFLYATFSYGELNNICQYNSQRTKPSGYSYYIRDTRFEYPTNFQMQPYINYVVINKNTFQIVGSGLTAVNKTYNVGLAQGVSTNISTTPVNSYKYIYTNSQRLEDENAISVYDYIITMDDTKIYTVNGNTWDRNFTELASFDLGDFIGNEPPASVTPTVISTNDIYEFCHTIIRMNFLYHPFGNPAFDNYDNIYPEDFLGQNNKCANNTTGVWNWHGFVDWLVSGYADFGGVNVPTGATVRFELVEQIIEEN